MDKSLSPMDRKLERKQEQIEKWFDATYEKRSFLYLRPVVAYEIFLSFLKVEKQKSLLDIACGIGQMLKAAETKILNLYGIDISFVAVSKAKQRLKNAQITKGNAESLPYDSGSMDYITCLGSLERMLDKDQVLKEMFRVLMPKGKACIMVRNSNRASWKFVKETLGIINKKGHQGAKTMEEWSAIFERNDFFIERVYHDHWPRNRWFWWLSFGGRIFSYNFKKIRNYGSEVEQAYELIFVLKKNNPTDN